MARAAVFLVSLALSMSMAVTGCGQPPADQAGSGQTGERLEKPGPGLAKNTQPPRDREPDGAGVLYFTVTVHLEGWRDDTDEQSFRRHAARLREYAALFEQYGAILTLESKEMTAGCLRWGDNVLAEMEQRGHAVAIHADVGAQPDASRAEITQELLRMVDEMGRLGLNPRHVSGICSRADWVSAAVDAGFEAITGVVSYGLWSLDENLRPAGFRPYKNIADGHLHYPWSLRECVNPWLAKDGATWIRDHPEGRILIIPAGPNLVYAYEESLSDGRGVISGDFTAEDIEVWDRALAEALEYTDSGRVNTLYAVWSLGLDPGLAIMEQWLQMVNRYVRMGRLEWKAVPEMIDAYNAAR